MELFLSLGHGININRQMHQTQMHRSWKKAYRDTRRNTTLPIVSRGNTSTGNNTSYDNIQPRQRGHPNTDSSTKASPHLNEGPTPTYLIGRSSFLTEIPAAEGGQRMLLAYKLCTRASSEECSNIGALEKSTWCNGHFLLFPSFLCVSLPFSVSRPLFLLGLVQQSGTHPLRWLAWLK